MRTLLILCALAAPALAQSTGSTSDAGPSVRGEWEALLAGGCDLDAHHVLTTIEAAALRNTPYALKGYVFKTPELARLFGADGGWYKPDPAVTAPAFALPEQACIKKLKDHEAALDAQAPLDKSVKNAFLGDRATWLELRAHTRQWKGQAIKRTRLGKGLELSCAACADFHVLQLSAEGDEPHLLVPGG
ncbi:MAG: YARHG domain-containing protein [bacterium]